MTKRVLILSDLHLGRPRQSAASADALRALWRGFDHLVVNGDAAEIHHPTHRAAAARQTLRLFDLCDEDGVSLTLLSGNHDPYISDRRHLLLAEGRLFVTHGDALHPAVAPWSPASGRLRQAHARAMRTLATEVRDELELRLEASQHASFAQWADLDRLEREAAQSSLIGTVARPWAVVSVLRYWRIFPALAAAFVARHAPEAGFAVMGHTHHPGVWHVDGRVIINTGAFGFPGHPRAVALENGTLSVLRVRRDRDGYRYDERPVRRYELQGTLAQPRRAVPRFVPKGKA